MKNKITIFLLILFLLLNCNIDEIKNINENKDPKVFGSWYYQYSFKTDSIYGDTNRIYTELERYSFTDSSFFHSYKSPFQLCASAQSGDWCTQNETLYLRFDFPCNIDSFLYYEAFEDSFVL